MKKDYMNFLQELDNRNYDSRIGYDLSNEELRALGIQDDTYRHWDEDFEAALERIYY
jgi:hypothetical protein